MGSKNLNQTTEKVEPVLWGPKVLVVDDLEKWLNVATNNLIYYGCERKDIFWAYNIEEGKKIYSSEKPVIVISDINFDINNPKNKEGLGFISFVNKDYIENHSYAERKYNFDLIAMSSLNPRIKREAIEAGADYFINKERFTEDLDSFVSRFVWGKKELKEFFEKGTGPVATAIGYDNH